MNDSSYFLLEFKSAKICQNRCINVWNTENFGVEVDCESRLWVDPAFISLIIMKYITWVLIKMCSRHCSWYTL